MAFNTKALIFLVFGSFAAFLGTGIICGGGFNSVMFTPTEGPYRLSTATATTTTSTATTATTTTAATTTGTTAVVLQEQVALNNGHYTSLLKQYPELFNWAKISDVQKLVETATLATGVAITEQVSRDAAQAYTRYHAGEQAWIFAFYLPLTLTVVVLAFIAYFRKNGYTLALVGLGLSAFMVTYTLVIVVHYQNISFVPEALNAFNDCNSVDAITRTILLDQTAFGTLTGPAPRRAWLCKQDWTYDNDFRTAANLVWGGAATCFVGYLSILLGFAYLVNPAVTPAPAFAKSAPATRSASLDFDDYSDYSSESY